MIKAIANARVFTGERWLERHAVLIDNRRVSRLVPQDELDPGIHVEVDLAGGELVPGFVDLQVNGGGGAMFNNAPTVDTLQTMAAAHRRFGTTAFLPTLITTDYATMRRAIAAVEEAIAGNIAGILGIHLEGPFLSPGKRGIHDDGKFRHLDREGVGILTSLRRGRTLVTLAPERTDTDTIRELRAAGVIVCAGHSSADYAQARAALDAGVQGFTHLYNAMTQLNSREPGMVGAALEDDDSWFGIIADGYHCHPASFRAAVRAKRPGGALLVTDAMATVGASDKWFELDGERIHAVDGRCCNAQGVLAGSDLDMLSAVGNAREFAGLDRSEALRMASTYPARALGLGDELGLIRTDARADLVALDAGGGVKTVWVDGCAADSTGGLPT